MIKLDNQEEMEEEETESTLDITMTELNTVTRSMYESLETEKESLLEKMKELERRIQKYEEKEKRCAPLLNMYKREKIVKNGSGAYQINAEVNRLSIILER